MDARTGEKSQGKLKLLEFLTTAFFLKKTLAVSATVGITMDVIAYTAAGALAQIG